MRIKILVNGDPIPAARPRFARGRAYQPRRNVEYRGLVQVAAKSAMGGRAPMTGELSAVVKLYRRFKATARNYGDLDNFLKGIFDGLAGICFGDDSQICRCLVVKFKDSECPRAEIEIEEI